MVEKQGTGKFVAKIVELFSRAISVSGEDKIYRNDKDNLYPNRVELVELNSVTALAASNKLMAFLVGRGFANQELNEMIVNKVTGMKGYEFLRRLCKSIKTHRGAYIHVNYDIEGNVDFLDVLPYKKCRKSKEDDMNYAGRIFYGDWEERSEKKTKNVDGLQWFYPFNRDTKVILDQRRNDIKLKKLNDPEPEDLIRHYRGQVYFFNLDFDEVYPYAWLHPVYNDADSEFRYGVYRNTNIRAGFIDKTMFLLNGVDKETEEEFGENVKKWMGAENTSNVFIFATDEQLDNPEKAITTVTVKGNYDPKRFEGDEKSIENRIRKAYKSIPKILIDPEDSFFSSSGEALKAAVDYYNKETLTEREMIAYTMDLFFNGLDFTIKELEADDLQQNTGTDTN